MGGGGLDVVCVCEKEREREREREICALVFSEFATCAHEFFNGFKVVKEMECEILKTRTNCARNCEKTRTEGLCVCV